MRISEWIERLKTDTDIEVHGAAELAAAEAERRRNGAFVIYLDDRAGGNALANGVRQLRTVGIGVVLAITNLRGKRGDAGIEEIEPVRERVINALVGWQPRTAASQVIFRGGQLMTFSRGTLWWQDEFEVTEIIGGVA